MTKPWQDATTLAQLYHGKGMTTREIATELGCTNGTVSRWLDKHDIQTRENWKAGVEAAKESNQVERVKMRTHERGYEYWGHTEWEGEDRVSKIVYVHRLLFVAENGFDAVVGQSVHHKNGVPWDNRPENIELMTRSEHQREHRVGTTYKNGDFVEVDE